MKNQENLRQSKGFAHSANGGSEAVCSHHPGSVVPSDGWEAGLFSRPGFDSLQEAFQWSPDAFRPPKLHDFDRMIFEEGSQAPDGSFLVPHLRKSADSCVSYLRPEFVARLAGCSLRAAVYLADYFAILDSTYEMVVTFCRWIRKRGVSRALNYFQQLATEIGLVEATSSVEPVASVDPDGCIEAEEVKVTVGSPFGWHKLGSLPARLPAQKSRSRTQEFIYIWLLRVAVLRAWFKPRSQRQLRFF